jgi:endothelin-converting enzyme/putative endopeptidase
MRRSLLAIVLLLGLGVALIAAQTPQETQNPPTQKPAGTAEQQPGNVTPQQQPTPVPPAAASAGESEQEALKPIPAFDITALDKGVNPCDDFYKFACGGWMAKNPIPSDQGSWGRFNQLIEHNRAILRQILEKAAAQNAQPRRYSRLDKEIAIEQKIGDFYSSCMDESKVNADGTKPIAPELRRIEQIASVQQMMDDIARLHHYGIAALFRFGETPDLHNATMTIAGLDQGGLGLPNKDYYTKTDEKSVEVRQKYQEHVQKMFELLGDSADQAGTEAKAVFEIENKLAAPSWDPVQRRNPANLDHSMTRQEVQQLAPTMDFARFFTAAEAPAFEKINVTNPEFFKQVNALLTKVPLASWKSYLRWHLVHDTANYLSEPFVQESFRFYRSYLGGQKELQARWKRCVALTDEELGEALGQPYAQEHFPPSAKQRTLTMVGEIERQMGIDLQNLSWMTPETKKAAAVKLAGVTNKIGYPDKWRDYSTLKIVRGDALGNSQRAKEFEFHRQLNKIGKPVDRGEWEMSPPTVNAYYDPQMNNINFPAGILQPPFFDNNMDDAVNFGGIGAVIGHELTHGFDDQGSKFDANGNLRDWWTKEDEAEFKKRTECIANEYDQFTVNGDLHLNGHLTLGENTADNGGVKLALMALRDSMKKKPLGNVEGFTPEQRFFIENAQIWCQNQTPEAARAQVLGNPHSPGRYRVIGVVQNMQEFREAFHCSQDAPMVSKNACTVW